MSKLVIYYQNLYIEHDFIERFFSDTTVDRIGLGVIAEFKAGTSEEDALNAMNKICGYIVTFGMNSIASYDK